MTWDKAYKLPSLRLLTTHCRILWEDMYEQWLIAGVSLVVGISDMTFTVGVFTFNGIVNGTVIAAVGYQIMRGISRVRGTSQE